jgi:hypothetical protein
MPGPSREPSLGLVATSLTIRSLPPGLLGEDNAGDWQQNHHVVLDEGSPRG